MDNKKTITIIILGLVAIAGILLFLFLPSKSHLANIDFYVYDTNDNFHYEVNERLELLVNDTAAIKGKRLIWEMGNGDTLMRNTDVSYTYRKAGKYLITLKIDGKHSVNKYIKVISGLEHEAIDSIPRINGVSEGYQGEKNWSFRQKAMVWTHGYGNLEKAVLWTHTSSKSCIRMIFRENTPSHYKPIRRNIR